MDEKGSRACGAGRLDNGTDHEANGDTVFEIGSITKTFTTLLLQDMVERGEMKLDDPVSKYLPASVKMPVRNGREITLLDLATPCELHENLLGHQLRVVDARLRVAVRSAGRLRLPVERRLMIPKTMKAAIGLIF